MNNKMIVAFLASLLSLASLTLAQSIPQDEPLYELVFIDDFDSTALNMNAWNDHVAWSRVNKWNSNVAHVSPNGDTIWAAYWRNAADTSNWGHFADSSFVRMKFKREDVDVRVYNYETGLYDTVPFKFTGAMMQSKNHFKYGYYEIKFRVTDPFGGIIPDFSEYNAYGPNFWLWNSDTVTVPGHPNVVRASYSEIDVYEINGISWYVDANIHYRRFPNHNNGQLIPPPTGNPYDTTFFSAQVGRDDTLKSPYIRIRTDSVHPHEWRTMSCEWTPQYADFYYDSLEVNGRRERRFHRRFEDKKIQVDSLIEMMLIVDNYMPAAQFAIPFVDGATIEPMFYDIDYVKVYQIRQKYVDTTFFDPSITHFESAVFKSMEVSNGLNHLLVSGKRHLCAQDYVILQPGFEVSGNAEVMVSCRPYLWEQYHGPKRTPPFKDRKEYYNSIIKDIKKSDAIWKE